jgi:DNA-binding MarR family transcriptional regulator
MILSMNDSWDAPYARRQNDSRGKSFRRYDDFVTDPMDLSEFGRCNVEADGVNDRLALLVYRAGIEILARGEQALQELGIDGRDYTTLAVLATDQPDSQQELARLMGKAPPLIVAVVDELEARGLVARRRSERDRRRTVVELTDAGREMLARADAIADRLTAELFGALSADERDALHATLRRAMAVEETAAPA